MLNLKTKSLSEMTIEEKIGQLVMAGFPSNYYDDKINELVSKYKLGNVLLFTRNYSNANQMKELCTSLHKEIIDSTGTLPFIAIDQEGGTVTRMMKDVAFAPSHMSCGASSVSDASYKVAQALGRDMIMLGMNIDFAPCLEVNKGCMDHNHNVRCFGSNPETIAQYVKRYIEGLSTYGVLGTAKHFPGSGDSTKDSHLELPVIESSKERMQNVALKPFKANINVPCVMTTHCIIKAYSDLPTTLSHECLTGLLKGELGYKGVVFTDGLEMKSIADHFGLGEAAVMAINAGAEIVLMCHDTNETIKVIERLRKAYADGELSEETIDERVKRILEYKEKTIPYLNKYFNNDSKYVASKENEEMMQNIVDKSITLLKGKKPIIGKKTLILAPVASVASQAEDVFDERDLAKELKKYYDNPIYKFEAKTQSDEFINKIKEEVKHCDDVLIISYDCHHDQKQIDLINYLIEEKKDKAYVVSLKGAMDSAYFKNMENYLVMYEYTPNSIRSLLKYFKGEIEAEGKLPVD